MPTYDRKCAECDTLFEVVCKFVEKDNTFECPECGATDGVWMLSAPAVSMEGTRFMNTDARSGFGEVVKKIQKTYPRAPINER
jgi:putative FmdB family regulatory protein